MRPLMILRSIWIDTPLFRLMSGALPITNIDKRNAL